MQGVFTGEVLTELFATLGDMRDIMTGMAYAAQFVALCGVMLVGGMAVSMRKRMLGTLRVLGAPARLSGAQRLVRGQRQHRRGHAGGPAVRLWPFRRCGAAHVPPDRDHALPQLTLAEGSFAAASFALGSLCALFPAYMVYRKTGAVALGDSE